VGLKEQGPRVIYSSINNASIDRSEMVQSSKDLSEIEESKVVEQSVDKAEVEEITYENYMFYLQKLQGDTWAMTQLSFEAILGMISHQALSILNDEQLYWKTIQRLVPFLTEKRAKMYESCCLTVCSILEEIRLDSRLQAIHEVEEHCCELIEPVTVC
jgi:hypothetical protein